MLHNILHHGSSQTLPWGSMLFHAAWVLSMHPKPRSHCFTCREQIQGRPSLTSETLRLTPSQLTARSRPRQGSLAVRTTQALTSRLYRGYFYSCVTLPAYLVNSEHDSHTLNTCCWPSTPVSSVQSSEGPQLDHWTTDHQGREPPTHPYRVLSFAMLYSPRNHDHAGNNAIPLSTTSPSTCHRFKPPPHFTSNSTQ